MFHLFVYLCLFTMSLRLHVIIPPVPGGGLTRGSACAGRASTADPSPRCAGSPWPVPDVQGRAQKRLKKTSQKMEFKK